MWAVFAALSALFAAATAILTKLGVEGVSGALATAIRTVTVLVMSWLIVFVTGGQREFASVPPRSLLFLTLSGIATGLSWLCYNRALQLGNVSQVAPVDKLSVVLVMILAFLFLGETPGIKTIIGGVLITAGTLVMIL